MTKVTAASADGFQQAAEEGLQRATGLDVAGARHMVAGDQNDQFSSAILDFLNKLNQ